MGTIKRTKNKANAQPRYPRLNFVMALSPALTQAAVLIVAICTRNWMMLAMVAPSLVTSVIFGINTIESGKSEPNPASASAYASSSGAATSGTDNETGTPTSARSSPLSSFSLETLLTGGSSPARDSQTRDAESFSWRWIIHRWLNEHVELSVPIGSTTSHTLSFDLLHHGPHALVGGTTGSGKSVLLQTWCLSLAAHNPPSRLNFVFLDFKGGSTFRLLHHLPHVAGFVSDLSLEHAARALKGLEEELTRREGLVAAHHATDIRELASPPAHLLVVIDEFAALKTALPHYLDHLMRIASQGRSLGIHLVLATQNPQGQISADMKANISLDVCLRVRDALQSQELIGSPLAAQITPQEPGTGYMWNGDDLEYFRCAAPHNLQHCLDTITAAARFLEEPHAHPIFSDPLPAAVSISELGDVDNDKNGTNNDENSGFTQVPVGLVDSGTRLAIWNLDVTHGNIAIIGPSSSGKTTALHTIEAQVSAEKRRVDSLGVSPHFLFVDDADTLFDPMNSDERALDFRKALADRDTTVIFSVSVARLARFPEYCSTRVIFPTYDTATDLIDGIPKELLETYGTVRIKGRAVELTAGKPRLVQFATNHLEGK
jgi:S-DNA-T family DNA segregation ATPase FtsK/SpoIIIE